MIADMPSQLQKEINRIENFFGGESVQGFADRHQDKASPAAGDAYSENAVQCNYMSENAGAGGDAALLTVELTADEHAMISELSEKMRACVSDVDLEKLSAPCRQLAQRWSETQENPLDEGIDALVGSITDLLGGASEKIVDLLDTLLEKAADLIGIYMRHMNKGLQIPFLSSLYKIIMGDKDATLRARDLFSLTLAVPLTILHKVVFGERPFTHDYDHLPDKPEPLPLERLIGAEGVPPDRLDRRQIEPIREVVFREPTRAISSLLLFTRVGSDLMLDWINYSGVKPKKEWFKPVFEGYDFLSSTALLVLNCPVGESPASPAFDPLSYAFVSEVLEWYISILIAFAPEKKKDLKEALEQLDVFLKVVSSILGLWAAVAMLVDPKDEEEGEGHPRWNYNVFASLGSVTGSIQGIYGTIMEISEVPNNPEKAKQVMIVDGVLGGLTAALEGAGCKWGE
jgi:hypothetical protein